MIEVCKHCNSTNIKIVAMYKYHDIYECSDCKNWTRERIDTCCRNPDEIYVFEYDDSRPKFIRLQCCNCGGCLTMTKPFPFAQYSKKVKGEFLKLRFQDWKHEREIESKQIFEISQYIILTNTTFYKYNIYLLSPQWKALREAILIRDNYTCQFCKQTEATEVHHLTYENLENESLNDLISCCKSCHLKQHERKNKK